MFKKNNMLGGSLSGTVGVSSLGSIKIATEADAAIGSNGLPMGDYIQKNQGAASKPLLDDASNDWIDKMFEAQELSPEGIVMGEPAPSRMPYDTSWKSSYYGRYPDKIGAMGLNSVSDDEESDGYLEYEDSVGRSRSASELTVMEPLEHTVLDDQMDALVPLSDAPYDDLPVPPARIAADTAAFDAEGGFIDPYRYGEVDPPGKITPFRPETRGRDAPELSFEESRAEGVTGTSETLGGLPNPPTNRPVIEPLDATGYDSGIGSPTDPLSVQPRVVDADAELPGIAEGGRGFFGRAYDSVKSGVKGLLGKSSTNELAWAEPLLQGTEMMEMTGKPSHKALPFKDQPSQAELSALDAPGPELGGVAAIRPALSQVVKGMEEAGMGPKAIAAELGVGLSKGGGMWISRATLGQYLAKQGKGLLMSPLISGLVLGLNQIHDGVGDMVSLGLIGADLLMTGDPLGILVYGVGQLWDAAAQSRQKVIDNDTPDKDYGTKMGYVREGDTWYPAIFNQRYKSTGLWSGDQQITMDYGQDIIWKMDGEGNFKPMIPDAKAKNFVAADAEWDGETKFHRDGATLSSKAFVTGGAFGTPGPDASRKLMDTTRDWYFLSQEDMKKVHSGELHLESYTDDETEMNSSARQLNDWRKALDHSQDWKWSSAVQTMGAGAAVNNYAGSRELQRIMYESEDQMTGGIYVSSETDYDKFLQDSSARTGDTWDDGHSLYNTFGSYLKETVLKDHIQALYRAQLVAAKEIGFDKLYGSPDADLDKLPEDGGTVWSAAYLDMEKDLPTASSADELQEQLHNIEMMNDRTAAGRNYLAQKAQTRYWMQQISAAGGSQDMFDYLYGYSGDKTVRMDIATGKSSLHRDGWQTHKYTASALREFQQYIPDQTKNKFNPYGDYLQGFVQPWQNDGEGALPNYTGALERTNAENFIDPGYRDAYEDMGRDGWENMKTWIETYGKVDPNARISALEDLPIVGPTETLDTTTDKTTVEAPTEEAPKPEEAPEEAPSEDALITTEDNVTPEMLMKNLAGTGTFVDTLGEFDWKPPTVDPVKDPVVEDPVDAWRKRGIELGVIDADFALPTRAGFENSHTPDISRPATHAVSVPHRHTIEHEDFGVPGMSSSMLAFIHAAEAPPSNAPHPAASIKVI